MATLTTQQAESFYDGYGARQESQAYYEDAAFSVLAAHGQFGEARQVVELGCGTGRFAWQLFAEHFADDTAYLGLDVSDTMVGLARDRLRPWQQRAKIIKTDGTPTLPLETGSADRVVATFVLDLLSDEDTETFVNEAHRVLRPGGLLCLASLNEGQTVPTRIVSLLWKAVYRLNPRRVGGCRPVHLPSFLPMDRWQIAHRETQSRTGLSFDVVVAGPQ